MAPSSGVVVDKMKIYVIAVMLAALAPSDEAIFNECLAEQPDVSKVWARDPDALRYLRECVNEDYVARDLERRGLKRHN